MDMTVFETLRAAEAVQAAEVARAAAADRDAWQALVAAAAAGTADARAAGKELRRLGRSADELQTAAGRHARREELRAGLDEMAGLRRRVREIDDRTNAAYAEYEKAAAPLARERAALTLELMREATLKALMADLDAAERAVPS